MVHIVFIVLSSLFSFSALGMEGQPTESDTFKARQQELLAQASFSQPYDPTNLDSRNQLIALLRNSLRPKTQGVDAQNTSSPTTEAALAAQGGGSLLNKLLRRKTNPKIKTSESAAYTQSTSTPSSTNSTPRAAALSATSTPHNGSPRDTVPELMLADSSVGFFGLPDDNPVVEATDRTIREVGYNGFLELLQDLDVQEAFQTSAQNSERLARARSESPGRKSGTLTPKIERSTESTSHMPTLNTPASAPASSGGSASAPVSPSHHNRGHARQGSGLLKFLHKKDGGK